MMEHGYSLHFEDDLCVIHDKKHNNKLIAEVRMENCNFPLRLQMAMKAQVEESWL